MSFSLTEILLGGWIVCFATVGQAVYRVCGLSRFRLAWAHLLLSPALGMAIFVFLATAVGWTCGMSPLLCFGGTFGLVVASLFILRGRPRLLPLIAVFATVVSVGPLASLIHYEALPVFNDGFTYLVHSQWLQGHAFHDRVEARAAFPTETQVLHYKGAGFRMGISFLFGWIQAASGARWATSVYATVASLCLGVGCLSIAGWAAALVRGRILVMLGVALFCGISIGGYAYGISAGFLPQLGGLALGTAFLAWLSSASTGPGVRMHSHAVIAALLLAACGYAYSEFLPFIGVAAFGWWLARLILDSRRRLIWIRYAGECALVSIVLWNGELIRIKTALLRQAGAVVGWPVPWPIEDFVAHAAGFRSGSGDGNFVMLPAALVCIALILVFIGGGRALQRRNDVPLVRLLPALVLLVLMAAFFVYSRYHLRSPWGTPGGQTWNQFKLANWSAPVLTVLLAASLAALAASPWQRTCVGAAIVLGCFAGIWANVQLAPERAAALIQATGREIDPLEIYERLPALIDASSGKPPIYLNLGSGLSAGSLFNGEKSRQIAAFFLQNYPTSSDWSDDGYIFSGNDPTWVPIRMSECPLVLQIAGTSPSLVAGGGEVLTDGKLTLSKMPDFLADVKACVGGYGAEHDHDDWWVWTDQPLSVVMDCRRNTAPRMVIELQALPCHPGVSTLVVTQKMTGASQSQTIRLKPAWQYLRLPCILKNTGEITLIFSSNDPARAISARDTRVAKFLVKDVSLQPAF